MEYSVDDFLEYIAEEARQKALLVIQIKKQEKRIKELEDQLKASDVILEEGE